MVFKLVSRQAMALLAAASLAACGGGGGTGSGGSATAGGGTGSTSGIPTTSPTASPLPPAPFGLTGSADFALVGWQDSYPASGPPLVANASDKVSLRWSAPDKTYAIQLTDLASGLLNYTSPGNNPAAFSIIRPDGTRAVPSVSLYVQTSAIGLLYWNSNSDASTPTIGGRAYFGIPTSSGNLPASGKKVFVTDSSPQSSLVVDFATRKVSGTVTTSYTDAWGPYSNKVQGTLAPSDLKADGSFSGTITVPGAPTAGELSGRLFGADASTLAVYWNGPAKGGYDDTGWTDWRDVMAYLSCATCTP